MSLYFKGLKKKTSKTHISETVKTTTTLSCTVMQLGMVRLGGIGDFNLRKKDQNARLDPLFGFPAPVCQRLKLERSYLAEWQT